MRPKTWACLGQGWQGSRHKPACWTPPSSHQGSRRPGQKGLVAGASWGGLWQTLNSHSPRKEVVPALHTCSLTHIPLARLGFGPGTPESRTQGPGMQWPPGAKLPISGRGPWKDPGGLQDSGGGHHAPRVPLLPPLRKPFPFS